MYYKLGEREKMPGGEMVRTISIEAVATNCLISVTIIGGQKGGRSSGLNIESNF